MPFKYCAMAFIVHPSLLWKMSAGFKVHNLPPEINIGPKRKTEYGQSFARKWTAEHYESG